MDSKQLKELISQVMVENNIISEEEKTIPGRKMTDPDSRTGTGDRPMPGDKTVISPRKKEPKKEPPGPKLIGYNEFLNQFENTFGQEQTKDIIARGLLAFFNKVRLRTGTTEDSMVDNMYTNFKNSEYVINHLQGILQEEDSKDE